MVAGLDEGGDAFGSYFVGGDFIPLPLNIRTRLMYSLLKSNANKRNQPPILHPSKKRMTLKYIIVHRHAHRHLPHPPSPRVEQSPGARPAAALRALTPESPAHNNILPPPLYTTRTSSLALNLRDDF